MRTKYTHKGFIQAIGELNKGNDYTARLRRVGKWWETHEGRRFDSAGNERGWPHGIWRLKIKTIERL